MGLEGHWVNALLRSQRNLEKEECWVQGVDSQLDSREMVTFHKHSQSYK